MFTIYGCIQYLQDILKMNFRLIRRIIECLCKIWIHIFRDSTEWLISYDIYLHYFYSYFDAIV